MTLLTPEQIAAAQKTNLETLFGLTAKAFEGVEKLVELNLQVVKSTLAESQENAQRALSVKDAQELLALQASLAQPVAEKVLSYGRHVYEIASATQAEFARVAEAQYEEQNRKVQSLVVVLLDRLDDCYFPGQHHVHQVAPGTGTQPHPADEADG